MIFRPIHPDRKAGFGRNRKGVRRRLNCNTNPYQTADLSLTVLRQLIIIFPVSNGEQQVRVTNLIKDGRIFSQSTVIEDKINLLSSVATKWFDCLYGDEMIWDSIREIDLDEFPGVTFRAYSDRIEAVTDKEVVPLYTGMPIWSVYFCDLNGDGKPELCSTLSIGSGIVENCFIIYDYALGASYVMSDRMEYDYTLSMKNGKLMVEKRGYMRDELLDSGELVFQDNTYQIMWDCENEAEKG